MLCDFILEDGDQGAWLFQQIIEDELRQLYNRHLRVSTSEKISRQIIKNVDVAFKRKIHNHNIFLRSL